MRRAAPRAAALLLCASGGAALCVSDAARARAPPTFARPPSAESAQAALLLLLAGAAAAAYFSASSEASTLAGIIQKLAHDGGNTYNEAAIIALHEHLERDRGTERWVATVERAAALGAIPALIKAFSRPHANSRYWAFIVLQNSFFFTQEHRSDCMRAGLMPALARALRADAGDHEAMACYVRNLRQLCNGDSKGSRQRRGLAVDAGLVQFL